METFSLPGSIPPSFLNLAISLGTFLVLETYSEEAAEDVLQPNKALTFVIILNYPSWMRPSDLKTKIKIPRMENCQACAGSGASAGTTPSNCPTCSGHGQVRYQQGFFSISRSCSHCQGTGRIIRNPCKECRGEGRVQHERVLDLKIPAGVDNGQRMRIQGEGEAGSHGGPPGDLDVVFFVKEHEFFERQQNNILCTVPISFAQAALGAEITVPTLDSEEKLKIPEGTQTGKVFCLKGKGLSSPTGRGKGDQFVRVNVVTPTRLSRDQKRLLEQFSEISQIDNRPLEKKILQKVKDIFA